MTEAKTSDIAPHGIDGESETVAERSGAETVKPRRPLPRDVSTGDTGPQTPPLTPTPQAQAPQPQAPQPSQPQASESDGERAEGSGMPAPEPEVGPAS